MRPPEIKTVEYDGITITVAKATVRMGMARATMRAKASQGVEEITEELVLKAVTYPDLTSVVVEMIGMDRPPFEEFLELPEELINVWGEAVYELNPSWALDPGQIALQEKKALKPASE